MDVCLASLALFTTLFVGTVAESAGKVAPKFSTNPKFHHRAYQEAIVLGNYLYIDGGEITTWSGEGNGIPYSNPQDKGNIWTRASNWTYSIDLSSSWDNTSVVLNPIDKNFSAYNLGALWADAAGKSFYMYDGNVGGSFPDRVDVAPATKQLWRFTPSGKSGLWAQASAATSSPEFSRLVQAFGASYASANGIGSALGGIINDLTSSNYDAEDYIQRIPGIVVYNDTSREWHNTSSTGFSDSGFAEDGTAHLVPIFGPEGLFLTFGGRTADTPTSLPYLNSFITLAMFDPVSKQWRSQAVTGEIPTAAGNPCVVGLEGDDATYEIFMYGGIVDESLDSTIDLGAVYVLSLPAFHWTRYPNPFPFGRWVHSCQVVGNRQMISIGGKIAAEGVDLSSTWSSIPDPWDQGIGIFDMSELQWKSSYDASAEPYETPAKIKEWYKSNAKYPSWSNPLIEKWFTEDAKFTRPTSDSDNSSNTAAIAGGVVGGLLGLAVTCAVVIFLLIRRKRKNRVSAWEKQTPKYAPHHYAQEIEATNVRHEMATKERPVEHGGAQVHELEGAR